MYRTLLTTAAAAALLIGAAGTANAEPVTLTLVHVNDLDRMDGTGDAGGPARVAAVVNQIRAANDNVLVTFGGDAISPSLLSGFDKGAHMIDLFNQVGVDIAVLGNHEFDFGPEVATQRVSEAQFPVLSNNAIEPDGTLIDGITESVTIDVGGHQVAFFGLTTAGTAVKSSPGDVTFADPVETAEAMSDQLREAGADLVVALSHTDLGEDAALFAAAPADIVLSGDDHDLRVQFDGRSALVESGSQGEFVTVVTVTMEEVEGRNGPQFVWQPAFDLINTTGMQPDAAVAASVQAYEEQLSKELDIEIGNTTVELDTRRTTVRSQETGFANLIVDAMRETTGADLAITNGGGIRADRTYDPGTVLTRRDVQSELPFGNKTILIEVSGSDFLAALENGVSAIEDGGGRFPHVSGASFTFDAAKEAGARVTEVSIDGAALDPGATYKLATNDFMGRGGDGYGMFAGAPRIIDSNAGELMAAQVIRYIEGTGTIAPAPEGRVTQLN